MKVFKKIGYSMKEAISKFDSFSLFQKVIITILVLLTLSNISKILGVISKMFEGLYNRIIGKFNSDKSFEDDCPDEYDPFDGEE